MRKSFFHRVRPIAVLAAAILIPMAGRAQCPDTPKDGIVANPNRPTVANPADITQYGVLEVEYGYDHVMGLQQGTPGSANALFCGNDVFDRRNLPGDTESLSEN